MNPESKQFKDTLRSIRLSSGERARMREDLMAQMALIPLADRANTDISVRNGVTGRHQFYRKIFTRRSFRKTMPIALLIALLMSGGVSYAAENTVPGDTLYPVKIHVNESVRSTLAVGESAKAKVEVDLAARRLNEASTLEKEHKLDENTKKDLKQRFNKHRVSIDARIKNVEKENKEDADEISKEWRSLLGDEKDALEFIGADDDDDRDEERRHGGEDDDRSGSSTQVNVSANQTIRINKSDDDNINHQEDRRGRDRDDDDEEEGDDNDNRRQRGSGTLLPAIGAPVSTQTGITTGTTIGTNTGTTFTMAQIASHNNEQSCYTTVGGNVYDITSYISVHKGGAAAILGICGKNGSMLFQAQHAGQPKPETALASFKIGTVTQ